MAGRQSASRGLGRARRRSGRRGIFVLLLVAGATVGASNVLAEAARGHGLSDTLWNQLPERVPLAVMLVDGSETPLTTLSQEIARPFGGTAGLLLPVFVTSGNFALVFDGYLAPLQGSDLDRQTGALLLGEVEVRATRDEIDPELQVVHARCEAKAFRADRSFAFIAFEATGEGVEYRLDKAREEAMQAMKAQLVEQVRKLMDSP